MTIDFSSVKSQFITPEAVCKYKYIENRTIIEPITVQFKQEIINTAMLNNVVPEVWPVSGCNTQLMLYRNSIK